MRRKMSAAILLFVFFSYMPVQSMAWGQLGHRVVGQIANSYLSAKTKIEITKILGTESVALAGTWADFIRSDTSYKYLDVWHYINFDKGLNYDQFKGALKEDTSLNDAYNAITFLTKELKKKSLPKNKKQMYLRLLIHFVGDIHQPLHVSAVGTQGGNDIKVQWFGQASNLHRVWDSDMIEGQDLSYTEYAMHLNYTTLAQRKKLQADPLSKWFFESYTIAQQLHDEIKETNPRFSFRYTFDHLHIANERMLKGGVRLAGLLNEIFGK